MFRVSSFEFRFLQEGRAFQVLQPETATPHRREAGFTLLEVVIAIAILGVTFAFTMELLASGVRSVKASEEYIQAALLARQKMAEVVMTSSLDGTADGGELGGGFRWVSEIQPLPQEEEELPARLYQVWVRVTWPGRRGEKSLDLYTMRMGVNEAILGKAKAVQPGGRSSGGAGR